MADKIINYYVGGNTAKGFHSLLTSNLINIDKVFILKCYQTTVKSNLLKIIGEIWHEHGYDIEYLHCPSDNECIEGIINPDLSVCVLDQNIRHNIEVAGSNVSIEYISFEAATKIKQLEPFDDIIYDIKKEIDVNYEQAYKQFEKGLKIHDEWEEIYINNMDFTAADNFSPKIINKLLGDKSMLKESIVKHRFFGAATPNGPIDFIENITSDLSKRYFMKGRPGTGKSTMLKRLVKAASEQGFDVEVYHCGFDPYSLDMVIIRELDFVIFDSTAPHEYFPTRDNDEVIDMYEALIAPGTDVIYKDKLDEIIERYSEAVDLGTHYISKVKQLNDEIENIYMKALDVAKLEEISEELIYRILNIELREIPD